MASSTGEIAHSATHLSVREFERILSEGVKATAEENGWSFTKPSERGLAFQRWIADLITSAEEAFDTDPEDSLLTTKDLGADVVLEDASNRRLAIIQCKHVGKKSHIRDEDVSAFFARHDLFMDRNWVRTWGSSAVDDALGDYADRVRDNWSIEYRFVSNGSASEKLHHIAEKATAQYERQRLNISCQLLDFSALKAYYINSLSLDAPIPDEVAMDLPEGRFFEKQTPYQTIIAVISGNELRNLYSQYKNSLFAYNIRDYLGSKGINKDIAETVRTNPEHFFYFNNGVSAVCTDYELDGNRLRAKGFQIINGAQTVTSLAKQDPQSNVDVLFRLTKTTSVKTESGINADIIRFNNSQNVIKVSDFRANDPIQMWLQQHLRLDRQRGPLPKFRYVRKRGTAKRGRGTGISLGLEEFAKIRYAFLYDPVLVFLKPSLLYTPNDMESDGRYFHAFGVDGALFDVWSKITLDEAFLAYALYLSILDDYRLRRAEKEHLAFLPRLKFHALSLLAQFVRAEVDEDDYGSLARNQNKFDAVFHDTFRLARTVIVQKYEQAMEESVTGIAYVRSQERWQSMSRNFQMTMDVQ